MGSSLYLCWTLHLDTCSVQVCEEAGHSTDLVGKGGRAGNSTWWDEPLSPESVWLGLGALLLSVFSLHGFVCGLSETFQESHSQLHGGNECKRRVWWLLEHLFNYILNTVKFVLLESVVHFKQQKKRLIIFKTEKITKQFCSTYSTVNTWVLWKPSLSLLLHWESRMQIAARCC